MRMQQEYVQRFGMVRHPIKGHLLIDLRRFKVLGAPVKNGAHGSLQVHEPYFGMDLFYRPLPSQHLQGLTRWLRKKMRPSGSG